MQVIFLLVLMIQVFRCYTVAWGKYFLMFWKCTISQLLGT